MIEILVIFFIGMLILEGLFDFFDIKELFNKNKHKKKCKWGCRCDEEE